ncbi:NUDIX domain-containing protein [Kitasatospora sp. NPDC059571]|uniref:NUDIX domain-containing protein n=1 Tax=Kitasatospora sp. NPDC059571 TaxID=3346871 RepID=UPI0036B672A1
MVPAVTASDPLAAAGVLFPDGAGRLMVVRAVYERRHPVEVPGGGWELQDATPRDTALREIAEEMAVRAELGPLACVDWALDALRPPIVSFLYWAAPLTAGQLAAVRLQEDELGGYAFVTPRQAASALPPKLSRRVAACLRAPAGWGPVELEDSLPVGQSRVFLSHEPAPPYTAADGIDLAGGDRPPVIPPLDRATYIATRPRIRVAVRILATDAAGRVLAEDGNAAADGDGDGSGPRLPGAVVAAEAETPRQAAARVLAGRPGLPGGPPGRLLGLDWLPGGGGPARLVYVFDGGTAVPPGPGLRPVEAGEAGPRTAACLAVRDSPGGPIELVGGAPAVRTV